MDNEKINNNQRIKRHLVCNEEVHELITIQCVKEYLKHHPEALGSKISQNHILRQVGKFYLER